MSYNLFMSQSNLRHKLCKSNNDCKSAGKSANA